MPKSALEKLCFHGTQEQIQDVMAYLADRNAFEIRKTSVFYSQKTTSLTSYYRCSLRKKAKPSKPRKKKASRQKRRAISVPEEARLRPQQSNDSQLGKDISEQVFLVDEISATIGSEISKAAASWCGI